MTITERPGSPFAACRTRASEFPCRLEQGQFRSRRLPEKPVSTDLDNSRCEARIGWPSFYPAKDVSIIRRAEVDHEHLVHDLQVSKPV